MRLSMFPALCLTLIVSINRCADDREVCVICQGSEADLEVIADSSGDISDSSVGKLVEGYNKPSIKLEILSKNNKIETWARWFPEGDKLIFNTKATDGSTVIATRSIFDDQIQKQILFTTVAERYHPVVQYPQGDPAKMAYAQKIEKGSSIFTSSLDGKFEVRLTWQSDVLDEFPDFYADRLVFQRTKNSSGSKSIWTVETDKPRGEKQLFNCLDAQCITPRFSKDGRRVLYSSKKNERNFDIYTFDIENDRHVQLTDTPYDEIDPDWSPDNDEIIYSAYRNQRYDLWIYNIETGIERKILDLSPNDRRTDWNPVDKSMIVFSISDDEKMLDIVFFQEVGGY